MAFAIIETGGKQYRVAEGDVCVIEKLKNHKTGDSVSFDTVLLIDDGKTTKVGTPFLKGASVEVTLNEEVKGKKLYIQKFKAKSRYKRRVGHRQPGARVQVNKIK